MEMAFDFVKMEGLGNDYVYVDLFAQPALAEALAAAPDRVHAVARRVADRHFGIGGDGLILVGPGHEAPFRMTMFNADGSASDMCGNGLRCVAKLVADRAYVSGGADTFDVESGAGVHRVEVAQRHADGKVAQVRVSMGPPRLTNREIPTVGAPDDRSVEVQLPIAGAESGAPTLEVTCVSMGNPHCVLFLPPGEDVRQFPLERIGPMLESHSYFPERTNVEVVQAIDETHLIQRTWERGSGETLACGSGACAVLVAAVLTGRAKLSATISLLGGDLAIEWDQASNTVYKTGPARTVFAGRWPAE